MDQQRGPGGKKKDPLIHKWETEIWESDEDDEIAKRVKNALDQIERLCRSHLKEV